MGLFDNFFGPGSTESNTVTLDKYNSKQQALLDMLSNEASAGLRGGAQVYGGDMSLGMTDAEKSYFDFATDPTSRDVREAAVRQAISGQPAYVVNDQTTQDYWDKYIMPEVNRQQRALNEQYAPGIFSGGRDIAQGEFNTGVLGQYADLRYKDEQARRTALTDAFNRQANTAQNAWNANQQNASSAAALERSIGEKELTGDYQRWMSGEADPVTGAVNQSANPYRALALNLLGISPYTYQQQTTGQGAGLGYGAATGLASSIGQSIIPLLSSALPEAFKTLKDWWNTGSATTIPTYDGSSNPEDYIGWTF